MSLPSSQRVLGIERGGQHIKDYSSSSFSFLFFSTLKINADGASGPRRDGGESGELQPRATSAL